jgi:DNA-binding response OmpR family regulator
LTPITLDGPLARRGDAYVILSPSQARLLSSLLGHSGNGEVWRTSGECISAIYDGRDEPKTVEQCARVFKLKLADKLQRLDAVIHTSYGFGYRLELREQKCHRS